MLIFFFKFLLMFLIICTYILISFTVSVFYIFNKEKRTWFFVKNTHRFSKLGLKILNIKVKINNKKSFKSENSLFISNHMSYIDVLMISAFTPTVFISSIEIKHTFFLGFMSAFGGSVFVERRKPSLIKEEQKKITQLLTKGFNVCIFPEATSSNGQEILPFKTAFFGCAKEADVNILPFCIKYEKINNKIADNKNLDYVCYYGDMYFLNHFIKLLFQKSIKASVDVLDPIISKDFSRKEMGEIARKQIHAKYFNDKIKNDAV